MGKKITQPDVSGNASDLNWFHDHPNKRQRLRPFMEGDDNGLLRDPPRGFQAFTLVERLSSGAFMRRFFLCRRQQLKDGPPAYIFAERMHQGQRIAFVFVHPHIDPEELDLQIQFTAIEESLGEEKAYLKAVCELALDEGSAQ
jgi:hypothetical protein